MDTLDAINFNSPIKYDGRLFNKALGRLLISNGPPNITFVLVSKLNEMARLVYQNSRNDEIHDPDFYSYWIAAGNDAKEKSETEQFLMQRISYDPDSAFVQIYPLQNQPNRYLLEFLDIAVSQPDQIETDASNSSSSVTITLSPAPSLVYGPGAGKKKSNLSEPLAKKADEVVKKILNALIVEITADSEEMTNWKNEAIAKVEKLQEQIVELSRGDDEKAQQAYNSTIKEIEAKLPSRISPETSDNISDIIQQAQPDQNRGFAR